MTPAVTRSCRWQTRFLYAVLWAAPVAGAERRLPAIVASPAAADRVGQTLRRWTVPAGVAIAPLVERERKAHGG